MYISPMVASAMLCYILRRRKQGDEATYHGVICIYVKAMKTNSLGIHFHLNYNTISYSAYFCNTGQDLRHQVTVDRYDRVLSPTQWTTGFLVSLLFWSNWF